MKTLLLFTILFNISAYAESDQAPVMKNAKPHKAEGRHLCQSEQSIGHSCRNIGINYMDCNQAFYKLRMDDCCSGSKYGGTSIHFELLKCSTVFREK